MVKIHVPEDNLCGLFSPNLWRYSMNTPVEFNSKNRPTAEYLLNTSKNVVNGMFRNIPDYVESKED